MQDNYNQVKNILLRAGEDMPDGKVLAAAVIWFHESQDGAPILRTLYSGQKSLRLPLLLSALGRETGWER